ncbi:MAG: sulfotransferase [Woeseiaceae bacterium]
MQATRSAPDLKPIQDKVLAKRFDDALDDLASELRNDPENPEALYMSAVCQRYKGNFDSALAILRKLKDVSPEYGRAHQEEGHAYRDMGRFDDAVRAYARACHFNPALEASWREQARIHQRCGRHAQAQHAESQAGYLQDMPGPLVAVLDLISQGRLYKAEDLCRRFLQKVPHDTEGMRLLADIGARLGVLDDAEFLLDSALKLDPDNIRVQIDLVQVLRKRQKFSAALARARELVDRFPDNPQFQSMFAVESMQTADYDTALEWFDKVLDKLPGDPTTLTSKGHAYKTCGDYDSAVSNYREAISCRPHYGEAYYSLANLKVYSFNEDEIQSMLEIEQSPDLQHIDRVYLNFALGKAFEDQKDYESSFRHYEKGNQLKKSRSRYDARKMTAELRAQQEVCTREFFEQRSGVGHDAPDPIFVVGLPRAGSTLLEQILSSHPMVDGTLELPNILSISQHLRRRRDTPGGYPEILAELPDEEFESFGRRYMTDTQIHRATAPRFVDKMPNNFRHIGLVHLILPNAKIIDARRHPMACGFSGFKQLFAEGQEFSYDLANIGRYYRDYVELMDHWDDVLPGRVLRVHYEDVVDDTANQVGRILDYCGLPFDDACLRFYETDRSIRTPSSEQVRQPVFRSALEQWRNFEQWLDPVRESLGPAREYDRTGNHANE